MTKSNPNNLLTRPIKCQGETYRRLTVKPCSEDAVHFTVTNGLTWETHNFCERHAYFYIHGFYPEEAEERAKQAAERARKKKGGQ